MTSKSSQTIFGAAVWAGLSMLAPALTAQTSAVFAGAAYSAPSPVELAPGQVVTLFFRGVKPGADGKPRSASAGDGELPVKLAGLAVRIAQPGQAKPLDVPVFAVRQENECDAAQPLAPVCLLTAIKVQIPYELDFLSPSGVNIAPVADLILDEDGQAGRRYPARVVPDNAHVVTSCNLSWDTAPDRDCVRSAYHADGRPVSAAAPAKFGDTIVVYAYGLGKTSPAAVTGRPAAAPARLLESGRPGTVWVNLRKEPFNASASLPRRFDQEAANHPGMPMAYAGLTPGQIGVYQINVPVPPLSSVTIPCGPEVRSNAILTVTTALGTENVPICIE